MVDNVQTKRSLTDFKRRETVFINLPSKGLPYPPGAINFSPSGELGIKPMTAADQITLSNPESLISGDATVKIFQSCASGIVYPESLLAPDIEAIFAGIRLATYGETTELEMNCPKCGHFHAFDMPIRHSLDNINFLPENPKAVIEMPAGDKTEQLEVYLRPYTLVESTQDANVKFQQSKAAQLLFLDDENIENPEIKAQFFESIQNIAAETIKLVSQCITKIVDKSDGSEFDLDDKEMIHQWVSNLPAKEAEKITDLVTQLNTEFGIMKKIDVTCEKCKHEWKANIDFEPSNFFGHPS